MDIEKKLKDTFNLKIVKVIPYIKDYSSLKIALGKAAARVFEKLIARKIFPRVGIGGGGTIYEMVDSLQFKPRKVLIYPMTIIGRGPEIFHVDSVFLVTSLFFKSLPVARAFTVGIPPLPNNKKKARNFKKYLLKEIPEVNLIYKGANNVDIAFIGAGAIIPMGDFSNELLKLGISIKNLENTNVIGGINYNWFDRFGNQIGDYFINTNIKNLKLLSKKNNKLIVLVAGGSHKIESIKTIITTKMVNSIVTDDLNANHLLNSEKFNKIERLNGKDINNNIKINHRGNYIPVPIGKIPCSLLSIKINTINSLRIKITDKCPFSCSFCHKEGGTISQDLDLNNNHFKKILDLTSKLNLSEVHLTGGEPTSHPKIIHLISIFHQNGLKVKMTSNGQFKPELINCFINSGLYSMNFSIHTLKPENLSKMQKPKRSTEWGRRALRKQIENLKLSKKAGIRVKVNTVVENIKDTIEIINFCKENCIQLRLLDNLALGSISVVKIFNTLESLGANIEEIKIIEGGSSYSYGVLIGNGYHFSIKAIRKFPLKSLCDSCDLRDKCLEWFYGIRIEQLHNNLQVRLCLHRQDPIAIQPIEKFLHSRQFCEIKKITEHGKGRITDSKFDIS